MKKAVVIIFTVLFGIADALLLLVIIVSAIVALATWGFGKAKEKSDHNRINVFEYSMEDESDFEIKTFSEERDEYLISFSKEVKANG